MINSTLSIIANTNAHNSITTPSIIEISMVNAIFPFIVVNPGVNRCRTAVTTITITDVVMIAINATIIIITSTRLLILLFLTAFYILA